MNKFLSLLSPVVLFLSILDVHAAVDPTKLIKVTKDNNSQCIEFYTYQNTLYCSTTPTSETSVVDPRIKNYEMQTIAFDERPWQAVWGKQTDEITTVEYVPAGDNIEKWHELVTSQYIPGIQNNLTPKQYADEIIKQLKDSGFKPIINMIKETPEQAIFEFRIVAPDNLKQDELQIINRSDSGFYIVHYVVKDADMGKVNRDKWLQNLQKSKTNPQTKQ